MAHLLKPLPCKECGGEGIRYTSKHGGNDPDVWPIGRCEPCNGGGTQICEDCGEAEATEEYIDPQCPLNRFLVCKTCFDEWTTEDNTP